MQHEDEMKAGRAYKKTKSTGWSVYTRRICKATTTSELDQGEREEMLTYPTNATRLDP
jgi:hypothetical protein